MQPTGARRADNMDSSNYGDGLQIVRVWGESIPKLSKPPIEIRNRLYKHLASYIYIYIYVRGTSLYYVTALQFSLFSLFSLFTFGNFQLIKTMKKNKENKVFIFFIFFIYFWRLPANKENEENKENLYFLYFLQPSKGK